jgi:hypothetical protein
MPIAKTTLSNGITPALTKFRRTVVKPKPRSPRGAGFANLVNRSLLISTFFSNVVDLSLQSSSFILKLYGTRMHFRLQLIILRFLRHHMLKPKTRNSRIKVLYISSIFDEYHYWIPNAFPPFTTNNSFPKLFCRASIHKVYCRNQTILESNF